MTVIRQSLWRKQVQFDVVSAEKWCVSLSRQTEVSTRSTTRLPSGQTGTYSTWKRYRRLNPRCIALAHELIALQTFRWKKQIVVSLNRCTPRAETSLLPQLP